MTHLSHFKSSDFIARSPSRFIQTAVQAAVCLAIAPYASLAAHAQVAQVAQADVRELPTVLVRERNLDVNGRLDLDTPAATGSRLGLTARETPATVTVVNRATIEARGAQDTQEILRGIPGVNYAAPPGAAGSVSYRGFSGGQITQLFNGITVQYDAIAARPVDSWIYDRVEAIGGASSFLFGAGAVGGSINYITKLAERESFSDAQIRLGTYNTQEVSLGFNRQLSGSATSKLREPGANYVRIDANHRGSAGYVDGNSSRSTQVAASLLSDITAQLSHTLAYEFQDEDVRRPYWGTPTLNPSVGELRINPATRFANYNSADGVYAQRIHWLRSLTDYRYSDALSFKNTLYSYDALRDYRNVEVYRYNAANTLVTRSSPLLQRHDQKLVGNRIEGTYKGQLGDQASDWAFGLDYSVNKQTRFPNGPTLNVSTVSPTNFTTGNFFAETGISPDLNPDRDNQITTTALYAENRTAVAERLHLVTALRVERVALDLTNRRAVNAANPAEFSRSYQPKTGRIGLVWDFAPGANAYVQYATAADPPSGLLATASFADVRNNSELTTGRQFELGSKFDFWQGKGVATVAAYSISRKNLSTPDQNNPNVSVLVGEQSSRGVELSVGIRPSSALSLQGNLALVDAQFDNFSQVVSGVAVSRAGNTPANTPKRVANLFASYAFTPALKGNLGVRFVGEVFGDVANTFGAPSYALLDLGLSYQISKTLTLTGRVRNATDKIYAASVTGTPLLFLGAPRTADLTLRASF